VTDFHPTTRDLQAWRLLCRRAREAAANPAGPGGDLKAAARVAFRAVAPSRTAQTTICAPFVRLAEAWAPMGDAARRANAATLLWLADALGPLVGVPEPEQRPRPKVERPAGLRLGLHVPIEPLIGEPRPERAPRADLEG